MAPEATQEAFHQASDFKRTHTNDDRKGNITNVKYKRMAQSNKNSLGRLAHKISWGLWKCKATKWERTYNWAFLIFLLTVTYMSMIFNAKTEKYKN